MKQQNQRGHLCDSTAFLLCMLLHVIAISSNVDYNCYGVSLHYSSHRSATLYQSTDLTDTDYRIGDLTVWPL